jgi:hypothetical protein
LGFSWRVIQSGGERSFRLAGRTTLTHALALHAVERNGVRESRRIGSDTQSSWEEEVPSTRVPPLIVLLVTVLPRPPVRRIPVGEVWRHLQRALSVTPHYGSPHRCSHRQPGVTARRHRRSRSRSVGAVSSGNASTIWRAVQAGVRWSVTFTWTSSRRSCP